VAKARKALDWEKQFGHVLDPDKAKLYRSRRKSQEKEVCSMCGELCAIKIVKDYLKDKSSK
jgi:phosphomethylpyrimidine synthase